MKYGSLEWAQDLLASTKESLENFKNAKEPLTSDETFQNMVKFFTNLAASLEKDIADGQYVSEKEIPAKDISDDEDIDNEEIEMSVFDYAPAGELRDYLSTVMGSGKHLYNELEATEKEYYELLKEDPVAIKKLLRGNNTNVSNDLGKNFKITAEDIDGDGDIDKVETTKINPNILGGVKEFGI